TKETQAMNFEDLTHKLIKLPRPHGLGNDEVQLLANSFNKMKINLQTYQLNYRKTTRLIEGYNKELEEKNVSLDNVKKLIEMNMLENEEDNRQLVLMHDRLKDANRDLEKKVEKRTEDISNLLDNIKSSIFTIGKDFQILPPVSKYSNHLFQKEIEGLSIFDLIFFNIRKGTNEFNEMASSFSLIFGGDKLNFIASEDYLPAQVTIPDPHKKEGRVLKLSYAPLLENEVVVKLMCTVEDITEFDQFYQEAKRDQIQYQYMNEILSFEDKEDLSKQIQNTITTAFSTLDDFVSPLSDTYEKEYFIKSLRHCLDQISADLIFAECNILLKDIGQKITHLNYWEESQKDVNYQLLATEKICEVLDSLLRYSEVCNLISDFGFNNQLSFNIKDTILDKVENMANAFKNLFEYVFLVRDVDKIDKEKLQKVVQLAKLYPDFERTIGLIHQRSKLLSFLLKALVIEDASNAYENLAILVKQMPERKRLNEQIIKHNLIDPYKIILEKTKDIKNVLSEKLKPEKKTQLNAEEYFSLLISFLNMAVLEEGSTLFKTKVPEREVINYKLNFIKGIEIVDSFTQNEIKVRYIRKNIVHLESFLRRVFNDDLTQYKLHPVARENIKFIKFIQGQVSKKKAA
ncbi:MAG: hypothetical protein VYD54_09415, partial [Bdellovibrionota bacterium]|nr:hypothetical protein [Bdellovibrionota bacterium]